LLFQAVLDELEQDEESDLARLYQSYRSFLIQDLGKQEFADTYAQSLTYGLFFARLHTTSRPFTRQRAAQGLPKSLPLIRALFKHALQDEDLPTSIRWIVDDLAALLDSVDLGDVLKKFQVGTIMHDPIVFFYEPFLAEYNREEREQRGVYYTPDPVVSYIICSVNALLKQKFGKVRGLAEASVTLLDPVLGTGTFLAHAIQWVKENLQDAGAAGLFPDVIQQHILKHFYGFELLAAPYIIAHLKLSRTLEELGYALGEAERLHVYLTNTLAEQEMTQ
jgi:predicted helicase